MSIDRADHRYRLLVENARNYAIFTMDVEGVILDWNPGAVRMLGWSEQEAVGRSCSLIFTPEDVAGGVAGLELGKAGLEGRAEDIRWHVRQDGSRLWATGTLIALRDEQGNLTGFAKVLRDETERKLAEQERAELLERERQARQQAEAANAAKDDFIAIISHELRSPLNTILGWSTLLRSGELDQDATRQALESIDRSARSQGRLIGDLLDAASLGSGKVRLEIVPVELLTLVAASIENVRPTAAAKSIHINLAVHPEVSSVQGDPDRLQQVMLNLLGNAIKFTPHDGRIDICLERQDNFNIIVVKDNGSGIEPDFLPHVFELYRQDGNSAERSKGGLGLGLSICRQIVEMHGGKIEAESEGKDRGTSFRVRLPV